MDDKKRRLLYNDDGTSSVFYPHLHPMTLDQCCDCVDQLVGTHCDTYILCAGSPTTDWPGSFRADVPMSDSMETGTPTWRCHRNAEHLQALEIDPDVALLQRAKNKGLQAIASIRMNDGHFAYSVEGPENYPRTARFWREHPEYRINPELDSSRVLRETDEWPGALFDYSHRGVHARILEMVDDVLDRADPDGVELDFMRHPYYFKPEEAPHRLADMTALVSSVRARLDEAGKTSGSPKALGVLVPATPEAGRNIGIDGLAWMQEGCLDYIVPKQFCLFAMDLPMEEYLRAARNTRTAVYACLENWPEGEMGQRPVEAFRGAAAHYWESGADGIYLYNYFNHRPHPLCGEDRQILEEIGDPELLRRKDKRYSLAAPALYQLEGERYQLPLEVTGNHVVHLGLGDETPSTDSRRDVLKLTFDHLVFEADVLECRLNGQVIPSERFAPVFDPDPFDFSGIACDLAELRLLRRGDNELAVLLKQRCPGASAPLILKDVQVVTSYRRAE